MGRNRQRLRQVTVENQRRISLCQTLTYVALAISYVQCTYSKIQKEITNIQ